MGRGGRFGSAEGAEANSESTESSGGNKREPADWGKPGRPLIKQGEGYEERVDGVAGEGRRAGRPTSGKQEVVEVSTITVERGFVTQKATEDGEARIEEREGGDDEGKRQG